MMNMWMIPNWLGFLWAAVLILVTVLHAHHAYSHGGQTRYWHVGHVLMALGMAYMYLPGVGTVLPNSAGIWVFGLLALIAAGGAVYSRVREGSVNLLWVFSAAEMAVMVYMFVLMEQHAAAMSHAAMGHHHGMHDHAAMGGQLTVINYVLAVYLFVQSVLWATGSWDRYIARCRGTAVTATSSSPALRISLVAMSAGMGYMLLAM